MPQCLRFEVVFLPSRPPLPTTVPIYCSQSTVPVDCSSSTVPVHRSRLPFAVTPLAIYRLPSTLTVNLLPSTACHTQFQSPPTYNYNVNPVARFESFVERLMERTLTRTPHSRLQPVEIAKRLTRVMDSDQVVSALGVRVPNIFDVELSPSDFAQFKPIQSSVTAELESYLAKNARDRLFVLASPPIVRLHSNSDLKPGEFGVRAQMEDLGPVANGRIERQEPVAQHTRAMTIPRTSVSAPRRHVRSSSSPRTVPFVWRAARSVSGVRLRTR